MILVPWTNTNLYCSFSHYLADSAYIYFSDCSLPIFTTEDIHLVITTLRTYIYQLVKCHK